MTFIIEVENIKCGGCANSIKNKLITIDGVTDVKVEVATGKVEVTGSEELLESVCQALMHLGYPEKGSAHGLGAMAASAKSFVSCAVGRMQESK